MSSLIFSVTQLFRVNLELEKRLNEAATQRREEYFKAKRSELGGTDAEKEVFSKRGAWKDYIGLTWIKNKKNRLSINVEEEKVQISVPCFTGNLVVNLFSFQEKKRDGASKVNLLNPNQPDPNRYKASTGLCYCVNFPCFSLKNPSLAGFRRGTAGPEKESPRRKGDVRIEVTLSPTTESDNSTVSKRVRSNSWYERRKSYNGQEATRDREKLAEGTRKNTKEEGEKEKLMKKSERDRKKATTSITNEVKGKEASKNMRERLHQHHLSIIQKYEDSEKKHRKEEEKAEDRIIHLLENIHHHPVHINYEEKQDLDKTSQEKKKTQGHGEGTTAREETKQKRGADSRETQGGKHSGAITEKEPTMKDDKEKEKKNKILRLLGRYYEAGLQRVERFIEKLPPEKRRQGTFIPPVSQCPVLNLWTI